MTQLMLIDGQQRLTTITLLIIALARYAKSHPERELDFTFDEIMSLGYLVNKYKKGDNHYTLTLSQGDRASLRSLTDNLENEDVEIVSDSKLLLDNLSFFEGLVEAIEDPNVVWNGIQMLEVVSVSLTQGLDNPQLIFESMNSTGKSLTSADLIRNYVLMGHPQQDELYRTYWRPIEETLGPSSYSDIFDEFVRNWLTVIYAPETLTRRNIYQTFKRYFESSGYGSTRPVENLLKELGRYARYYADITGGRHDDKEVGRMLALIRQLGFSVATPLLMSILDDYGQGAFDRNDLLLMLSFVESYLFRRAVCDCPTNSLNKFFPSLIGKLNHVQVEGELDYAKAFCTFLLEPAGTKRRFPSNAEFFDRLITRDAYHFPYSLHLLSRLENSLYPKNERDFTSGAYTIEHIMPQNALAHAEWRQMMGDPDEEMFELLLHNLGNLTLTAYNSELSDGTFEEKKSRAVGGYDVEWIAISSELKDATEWTPESIDGRARRLARMALQTWPIPEIAEETRRELEQEKVKKRTHKVVPVSFKDLFNAGLLREGDVLFSTHPRWEGTATVTPRGTMRLSNGEEFTSPSSAVVRLFRLRGASSKSANGWQYLSLGKGGPKLIDIRDRFRESQDDK